MTCVGFSFKRGLDGRRPAPCKNGKEISAFHSQVFVFGLKMQVLMMCVLFKASICLLTQPRAHSQTQLLFISVNGCLWRVEFTLIIKHRMSMIS